MARVLIPKVSLDTMTPDAIGRVHQTERSRVSTAQLLLWGFMAINLGGAISSLLWFFAKLISGAESPLARWMSALRSYCVLGGVALYFLVAVVFLTWLHYLTTNAVELEKIEEHPQPIESIGAFLIPGLNLVRPVGLMRRLFDSADPSELPEPTAAAIRQAEKRGRQWNISVGHQYIAPQEPPLVIWWSTFLGAHLLWVIEPRVWPTMFFAQSSHAFWALIGHVVFAVSAWLFARVLEAIQTERDERFRRHQMLAADRIEVEKITAGLPAA